MAFDRMLEPLRLRLEDVVAAAPPPQRNTEGGDGAEGRVREEMSPEARAWLKHVRTNTDDGLQHTAVRANLHAMIGLAAGGVAESDKERARLHLASLVDMKLSLERVRAEDEPARVGERIELVAMALAWMALQLLYSGRNRSSRRQRR